MSAHSAKRAWPKVLKNGKISIGIRCYLDGTIILTYLTNFQHGSFKCSKTANILKIEILAKSGKIAQISRY